MSRRLWLVLCATFFSFSCASFAADTTGPASANVYIVPFSHLDLMWGGTLEECLARGNRIINNAIQLAGRDPEFRFMLEDEVFVANFVESYRGAPELEAFKRLVKEGRIEIAPKWAAILHLSPAEAQVRNLIYGKEYARQVFGVDPQVAHLGDLPGYTWQYPQLLTKAAVPYAVMTRMGPPGVSLFRWKGLDGESVLTWSSYNGYGWGVRLGLHEDLDEARLEGISKEIAGVQATTAGPVFVHWGTDLYAPSQKLIENVGVLNKRLAPSRFRLATTAEYFRAASDAPKIPELTGDIPSSWANILTSMGHLWPAAVEANNALLNAEKFAAINYALGYADYPKEFELLWKDTLQSMDHNQYGQGGLIADEHKLGYAHLATLRAGEILRGALRNIAERVERPIPHSTAIVVFNPLSWKRDDVVKAHVTLFGDVAPRDIADYKKAMRLVDEKGTSVPFYVEEYSENISRALRLVFIARRVPPLGYKSYFLVPADQADAFPNASALDLDSDKDKQNPRRVVGAEVMENEFYRVSVDRAMGRVEAFDKQLNRTIAKDIEVWGAEDRGGNTLAIEPVTGRTFVNVIREVKLEENNPVRTVMRITGDVAGIPIVQRVTVYQGLKRIDFENTVDWKVGRFMKLEQVFPCTHPNAQVRYGIPFGSASETDVMPNSGPHLSDEVPREVWKAWRQIQDWVFAGNQDWGLTISADRQLITLGNGDIRIGMLRGIRFNPANIVRAGQPHLHRQPPTGRYVFRYSLSSGKGDWAAARSWQSGSAFSTPLVPVEVVNELSQKSLPPTYSFCSLDADNVMVTALKKADLDAALVLRVVEMQGGKAETPVDFLGRNRNLRPANLLEEPSGFGEQDRLRVGPYEITTLRLRIPKMTNAGKEDQQQHENLQRGSAAAFRK